ncbi:MAG: micrococcal nuclease [Thermotogaceae bacterium]|nr:micrococcal nuclease [Thermotogaceae bacterium]
MNSKNNLILMFFLLVSIALANPLVKNGMEFNWNYDINPQQYDVAKVAGHLYGDTVRIKLDGKVETITLLGVLSPDNPNVKPQYAHFSSKAAEFTKKLCPYNSTIYLTYDKTEKDKYNRRLACLWYKVNGQWVMHNLNLLANGYGSFSDTYFINEDYRDLFMLAEETAKTEKLGLWKKEVAKGDVEIVINSSSELVRIATVKYSGKPLFVEIKNVGPSETNLNGWFLLSVSSKRGFSFGNTLIRPYSSFKVYFGQEHLGEFYWEGDHIFNPEGDGVILYNQKGKQVSIYTWGY